MSNIETLTQHTITDALRQPGILVIDFWAPWCGPCRTMAPQFERAAQLRPQYLFAKVNVVGALDQLAARPEPETAFHEGAIR